MINIAIDLNTPPAMLRAIKAACDELLTPADLQRPSLTEQAATHVTEANRLTGEVNNQLDLAAAAVTAHNTEKSLGRPYSGLDTSGVIRTSDEPVAPFSPEHESEGGKKYLIPAAEIDSTGALWDAELHAGTRTKNADGTWKKKRGSAAAEPAFPPLPPAPPVPPADPVMPKIFALITSQICTLNDALAAAQAAGFPDLGANGLGGAPREAQRAVLAKLEG